MRKSIAIALLALTALTFSGCNSCRPRLFGWFNRGDACDPCDPCMDGGEGWISRSAGMMPSGPTVMPGPIEVTPAN